MVSDEGTGTSRLVPHHRLPAQTKGSEKSSCCCYMGGLAKTPQDWGGSWLRPASVGSSFEVREEELSG